MKFFFFGNLMWEVLLLLVQDFFVISGGYIRDELFDFGFGMGGGNYQFYDVDMNDL